MSDQAQRTSSSEAFQVSASPRNSLPTPTTATNGATHSKNTEIERLEKIIEDQKKEILEKDSEIKSLKIKNEKLKEKNKELNEELQRQVRNDQS